MLISLNMKFLALILVSSVVNAASLFSSKAALVIIDMQYVFMGGKIHLKAENEKLRISLTQFLISEINKAKKFKMPIIIMEYECDGCDQTLSSIKNSVLNYPNVKFMKKTSNGMLSEDNIYRREILDYLNLNDIRTLIIAGINGGVCVLESIYSALWNGYDVIALRQGIAHFDYGGVEYPFKMKFSNNCHLCRDRKLENVTSLGEAIRLFDYNK